MPTITTKRLMLSHTLIINDSEFSHLCENEYCTSHCSWSNNTISNEIIPFHVNREVIKNLNNNSTLITDRKDICYCLRDSQYDCYVDEIKSIYPGQTVSAFKFDKHFSIFISI